MHLEFRLCLEFAGLLERRYQYFWCDGFDPEQYALHGPSPRVTGRALLAALKRSGFVVLRVKGSHHVLRHADGRTTVVPVHAGESIGRGLLSKILGDAEITVEQLRGLL